MLKSRRNFRLGVCGAVLRAVYLGLAGSAMAWNEPLWVRVVAKSSDGGCLRDAR